MSAQNNNSPMGDTSDPQINEADLSKLRGVSSQERAEVTSDLDLENLAELVPDIKTKATETTHVNVQEDMAVEVTESSNHAQQTLKQNDSMFVSDSTDHHDKKNAANQSNMYASQDEDTFSDQETPRVPREFHSSVQSVSTATQTHDVNMPMYLPTFKPATGCTNASDFVVRCFVARLRSGITVVKHGRSRWCKSRLRILHIHPDGRSLSWKPAEGEPTSNKRPPKLDLSHCLEVRHAWSPDPQNRMYTGTSILRQKCETANAHKSFALIFKTRTVDITAVTADQCKVLMEGFSALCFRLQVANLARNSNNNNTGKHRPMPEEDGVSTTASATLTNRSTPKVAAS